MLLTQDEIENNNVMSKGYTFNCITVVTVAGLGEHAIAPVIDMRHTKRFEVPQRSWKRRCEIILGNVQACCRSKQPDLSGQRSSQKVATQPQGLDCCQIPNTGWDRSDDEVVGQVQGHKLSQLSYTSRQCLGKEIIGKV